MTMEKLKFGIFSINYKEKQKNYESGREKGGERAGGLSGW